MCVCVCVCASVCLCVVLVLVCVCVCVLVFVCVCLLWFSCVSFSFIPSLFLALQLTYEVEFWSCTVPAFVFVSHQDYSQGLCGSLLSLSDYLFPNTLSSMQAASKEQISSFGTTYMYVWIFVN